MGIHDGHREKMRRRFLETGAGGLCGPRGPGAAAVLAIPRRDTNPIAHALMERYDSLSGVLNAPVEDLEKVEGIGESAVSLLPSCRDAGPHSGRVPGDHPQLLRAGGGLSAGAICRRAAGAGLPAVPGPQGQAPGLQAAGGGDGGQRGPEHPQGGGDMALLTSASAVILALQQPPQRRGGALLQRRGRHPPGGGGPADHRRPPGGSYRGWPDRDFVSMADSGDLLG